MFYKYKKANVFYNCDGHIEIRYIKNVTCIFKKKIEVYYCDGYGDDFISWGNYYFKIEADNDYIKSFLKNTN